MRVRFVERFYLVRDYGLRVAEVTKNPDGTYTLGKQPSQILDGIELKPFGDPGAMHKAEIGYRLDLMAGKEVVPAKFVEAELPAVGA